MYGYMSWGDEHLEYSFLSITGDFPFFKAYIDLSIKDYVIGPFINISNAGSSQMSFKPIIIEYYFGKYHFEFNIDFELYHVHFSYSDSLLFGHALCMWQL